ncbi:MAG TPA: LysR substrate-binding domain-containing protein [Bryobacteraceae bacterium]|jgi:DNA-binding transcriptional LysR family regulator
MLLVPAEDRLPFVRTGERDYLNARRPSGRTAPPDSGFELRHLRYFVAVAEELHFGRAARALNISQPPLSRQIQDLERNVGTQLLNRSAKSVTLTEAGKVFLAESKRILAQVYRSVDTVRRATAGETGRLEIGFAPFFDSQLLPTLRHVLGDRYREAEITFHRLSSEEQVRQLRNGALDVGLVMLPIDNADQITIEQLFRLPAVALVADSHPLAHRQQISLRDVVRETLVDVRDDFAPAPYDHVDRISRMCGVPLHTDRYLASLERVFEDVREMGSLALLPSCVSQLAGPGFRCLQVHERGADFTFGMAHYRDRDGRLMNRFLQLTREVNLQRLRGRENDLTSRYEN